MTPYYEDGSVTLYHGDALDVLPSLPRESVGTLLTDPPYFQVKDEEWDRQWKRSADFLAWLGTVLDAARPSLVAHASVWVFAGPQLCTQVDAVVGQRFRVLNHIRWVKDQGWHKKAEIEAQRRYLSPWESVIFAEQFADAYGDQAKALHKQVFAPLGRYIQQERERAGWSRSDLEVALGYASTSDPTRGTALCYRWEEGSSLPTAETYERMRAVLNGTGGDYLRREHADLRREYEDLRRPFALTSHGPVTDVWSFPPVMGYPGKHPCEKPVGMVAHMLEVGSRRGDLILDPFVGSGSTLRAAKDLGRRAVGIEADERWCERAALRLSQDVLDFGEAS